MQHKLRYFLYLLLYDLIYWQFVEPRKLEEYADDKLSIIKKRACLKEMLRKYPELHNHMEKTMSEAYEWARFDGCNDDFYELSFPDKCPYTINNIIDDDYFPEIDDHMNIGKFQDKQKYIESTINPHLEYLQELKNIVDKRLNTMPN